MSTTDRPRERPPAPAAPARLLTALRTAPATVPAFAALALMVFWAASDAGYPLPHWAPGGLIMLALLAIALLAVRPRVAEIPLAVRVAVLCLAAYTALSFLSILWAAVPGDAWEGANRTLLYLLVFALFACWPQRGANAALLLCAWTLALVGLAAFTALHVDAAAASAARLQALLPDGRLVYPAGYVNADAAQWLMACWPALLLARSRRLPWGLRGALAGGAVLLAEVALLSQSRGALYTTPVMLALVFALLPGRVRTFALLVPVAAGIAAAAPAVLRVGERLEGSGSGSAAAAVHGATAAMFAAALAVALVVALGAAIEQRRAPLPRAAAVRVHRAGGAVALAVLIVLIAGGWAAAGDPLTRVRHAWDTFKSPSGYAANQTGESRLIGGLGSNRYDFYRVALDEFTAHPLLGIGADNFAESYLRHRRSTETPHYPHSIELRTLSQTGLLGALLAVLGLGAALLAGWRAVSRTPAGLASQGRAADSLVREGRAPTRLAPEGRVPDSLVREGGAPESLAGRAPKSLASDSLARCVAAAALAGFGYWAIHGSFDWFWEFAGLGAPAFALLGLACALAPRARAAVAPHGATVATEAAPSDSTLTEVATSDSPSAGAGTSDSTSTGAATSDSTTPPPARAGLTHARRPLRLAVTLAGALVAVAAIASFTAPWLSELQVQSAAHVWVRAPAAAYARLNDAAQLNPLSDEPAVVAGSIALRRGELGRADHEFALALARTPGDAYALLERGAIASTRGQRRAALALLGRAARLDPREPLTRQALTLVRSGRRVDVGELNRSILDNAQQL